MLAKKHIVFFLNLNRGSSSLPKMIDSLGYRVILLGSLQELLESIKNENHCAVVIEDDSHCKGINIIKQIIDLNFVTYVPHIVFSLGINRDKYLSLGIESPVQVEVLNKPLYISELAHRLATAKKLFENVQYVKQIETLSVISESAAGIAHEIRNPLAIVEGNIRLIEKNIAKDNLEKIPKLVDKTMKASKRIQKIVTNMQSSLTGLALEEKNEFIENILTEAISLSELKITKNNVKFELINKIPEGQFYKKCNIVKLAQSLANLINNSVDAVKFIQNEEERWIKVEAHEEGNSLFIDVIDSGAGVPEEARSKIFDNFFTTKIKSGGTGMGLTISRKFIEESNGKLIYLSESEYTVFRIELEKELTG